MRFIYLHVLVIFVIWFLGIANSFQYFHFLYMTETFFYKLFRVSSQPSTRTLTLTDLYPSQPVPAGSQVVPAMEKSTHNQPLGYHLTHAFQWNRSTGTLCKFYQIQVFSLCLFFYMNAQCQLVPWVNLNFFQHCY